MQKKAVLLDIGLAHGYEFQKRETVPTEDTGGDV